MHLWLKLWNYHQRRNSRALLEKVIKVCSMLSAIYSKTLQIKLKLFQPTVCNKFRKIVSKKYPENYNNVLYCQYQSLGHQNVRWRSFSNVEVLEVPNIDFLVRWIHIYHFHFRTNFLVVMDELVMEPSEQLKMDKSRWHKFVLLISNLPVWFLNLCYFIFKIIYLYI